MGRRQRAVAAEYHDDEAPPPPSKRLKTTTPGANARPKSRKELRADRKAARRAAKPKTPEEIKAERKRLKQQRRKEEEKEQFKQMLQQAREEKKLRKQQKLQRKSNKKAQQISDKPDDEQDMALRLVNEIKYGRTDESSGMTTLSLGVQYKDVVVVGKGPIVQPKSLVTVKYKLTGGQRRAEIDSNNKFTFRVGKGEVIQGFDVGIQGMRLGGRRQLIVPPKAGYGSKDIGAGPGAILYFDITILAVKNTA